MRLNLVPALFLAVSSAAFADHSCLEELSNGIELKRKERFPEEWFLVGTKSVVGPTLHSELKEQFGNKYVSGFEEGEYDYVCLKEKDAYVAVTTDGWGVGVDYSKSPPKCLKCNPSSDSESQLRSGSRLNLGQTKAQVSAIIQAPITSDVVTLSFDEVLTQGSKRVWHTEVLRLEFAEGMLIRFRINDYEESEKDA